MDTIASVLGWGLCLGIGAPLVLLGFFHFAFPKAAWSVYRGWSRAWGAEHGGAEHGEQTHRKLHPNINPALRCEWLGSPVVWEVL